MEIERERRLQRRREADGNVAWHAALQIIDDLTGDEIIDFVPGGATPWTRLHRGRETYGASFDRLLRATLPASLNAVRAAAAPLYSDTNVRGHLGWGLSRGYLMIVGGQLSSQKAAEPLHPTKSATDLVSENAQRGSELLLNDKRGHTMRKINIPAARVKQGSLVLYTTALKVKDLISENFYNVETLDPASPNGFQRVLNVARAKKLADYIVKGQDAQDAYLPTSVFLATEKSIAFNENDHTIEFDTSEIGPFSVVDGQHRLEGLKLAAQKDPQVLEFEIPVNIAIDLPMIAQMCHFLIVNITQKSVDRSVEQRIIARLTAALDVEDLPSLPQWILRTVEKGEVERAIKYVDYLNEESDSPWCSKIRMANSNDGDGTINQRSFVKAIVKYVLTANNPISIVKDFDKEKKIFLNYWKAIKANLDDGDSETLYKYGGVELFCKFSIPFFMKLQDRGSYTVQTMERVLKDCLENVEGDYAGVGHPDWWKTGGQAGRLNAGALNIVCQEMSRALHKVANNPAIEV
jgi:DGQHR domain-containing protein